MKKLTFFKFTDKKHHPVEIMAWILGLIALVSIIIAAIMPYFLHATSFGQYAAVCFMSMLFGIVSMALAIVGRSMQKSYGMFSFMALVEDVLIFIIGAIIIILGK